jgi:hypothetical protein
MLQLAKIDQVAPALPRRDRGRPRARLGTAARLRSALAVAPVCRGSGSRPSRSLSPAGLNARTKAAETVAR